MVQLISIHINKTAGTSFEQILRSNYPAVFKIHTHDGNKKYRRGPSCDPAQLPDIIPHDINVVHGHFKAKEILKAIPDTPVITWVRHPINRVISNYFYTEKTTNKSIKEYASEPNNQNRMSKMLDGLDVGKALFIGIQEHFISDIFILGDMLNWKNFIIPRLNTTCYGIVDANDIEIIKETNTKDIELYNRVLEMRKYV